MKKPERRIDPDFISILVLLALGLVAYSNSWTASFHLDDISEILRNEAITDLTDISRIFHHSKERFLPFLTLAINYRISKFDPVSYHTVNFFIHYFASIIVYFLFVVMWKTPAMQGVKLEISKRVGAFLAAGIFLLHPLQTESVTYVIQRTESMAGMFYFATLLFYVMARLAKTRKASVGYSIITVVSATCALFSKETAITLPAMLVGYELLFFNTPIRELLQKRIILFTLAIGAIIVAYKLENLIQRNFFYDPGLTFTRKQYLFTQFSVLFTYLRIFLWPTNQNVDWDYQLASSFLEPRTLLSFLLLFLLVVVALCFHRKLRFLSLGLVAFFVTLAPTSSIIPMRDVIFEHRMYLAVAFLAMGLVHLFLYGLERMREITSRGRAIILLALIMIILPALTTLTYARNGVWLSELSLWEDAVQKSPNKARTHNNYGIGLYMLRHRMNEQAKREFEIARRLAPGWEKPLHNLAMAAVQEGDYQQAIALELEAIKRKPDYKEALYLLGKSYMELNQWQDSRLYFERLIERKPGSRFAQAYLDLIDVYLELGLQNEARALANGMPPRDYHRGMAFYKLKDFDKAKYYFSEQLKLEADKFSSAMILGEIYYLEKNYEGAARGYRIAVKEQPRSPTARYNLAMVLIRGENFQEAVHHLEHLRETDSLSDAPAIHLIKLYDRLGDSSKRLEVTRKLLGLGSDSKEFNFLKANKDQDWNYTLRSYAEEFLSGNSFPSEERTRAIIARVTGDHVEAMRR
jgi:tetratricopeptide (TPR) repeat protein